MNALSVIRPFRTAVFACAAVIGLTAAGAASAALVTQSQTFSWTTGTVIEGGTVTYKDLGSNQLEIKFDNISSDWNGVITGLIFNVMQDINVATIGSFTAGDGTDLTTAWSVGLNINSSISPGNTKFDITFQTTNGVNSGIYNSDVVTDPSSNVVPDVATLVLLISQPDPWSLVAIGDDSILRMQSTGANGEGSLKIRCCEGGGGGGGGLVPEPGTLALLGGALFGLWAVRRRKEV